MDHTVEFRSTSSVRTRPRPAPTPYAPRTTASRTRASTVAKGAKASWKPCGRSGLARPSIAPAGGVARVRDLNKITNTQGYQTAVARRRRLRDGRWRAYAALKGVGEDIREGNFGSAALGTSAYLGGASELGAMANLAITGSQSTVLLNGARFLDGAPAAVVGAGVVGVQISTRLPANHRQQGELHGRRRLSRPRPGHGSPVEFAAAGYAIGSTTYHAPEAAVDYAKKTWTVDPSEVDWDRTLKPWKWF